MKATETDQKFTSEDIINELYEARKVGILTISDMLYRDAQNAADDAEDAVIRKVPDSIKADLIDMIHLRAVIEEHICSEAFKDGFRCAVRLILQPLQ